MSSLASNFFAGGSEVSATHWTENSRISRVLKIDIPSMIDVNKNKNKHVGKREVNWSTLFCRMLCNNFEMHYFHFSYHRKPNVPSSSPVRKTNVNKQRLFLALRKYFPLFLLPAAKSSLVHWTGNFSILLNSLTSSLPVWTEPLSTTPCIEYLTDRIF